MLSCYDGISLFTHTCTCYKGISLFSHTCWFKIGLTLSFSLLERVWGVTVRGVSLPRLCNMLTSLLRIHPRQHIQRCLCGLCGLSHPPSLEGQLSMQTTSAAYQCSSNKISNQMHHTWDGMVLSCQQQYWNQGAWRKSTLALFMTKTKSRRRQRQYTSWSAVKYAFIHWWGLRI